MDELTMVQEFLREERPASAQTVAEARRRLTAGARPRRPRVQVRLLAGAVAAGAAVAVAVTAGAVDGRRPPSGGVRLVAETQALADGAARRAAKEPWKARPDQWGYVKILLDTTKAKGGSTLGEPNRRWTAEKVNRLDGRKWAAWENGKMIVHDGRNAGDGFNDYPPTKITSLPADPAALLAAVYRQNRRDHSSDLQVGAFITLDTILEHHVLPPRVGAAVYGAIVRIPGVRLQRGVKDAAGRSGSALYLVSGKLRYDIIVNPKTYEYLGWRVMAVRGYVEKYSPSRSQRTKAGAILVVTARLAVGVVDRPDQRP
jgi:hypothetical protein